MNFYCANLGCGVGGKIFDSDSNSDLSKISDSDSRLRFLNIKGMKFVRLTQWKSCWTARNPCFKKSFKRNCTISTGIPNLRVWFKKWSNWTSGIEVGEKNATPTPSVVRNPTPPKTSTPYDSNSATLVQTQLHYIRLAGNFRKGVDKINWVAKWSLHEKVENYRSNHCCHFSCFAARSSRFFSLLAGNFSI